MNHLILTDILCDFGVHDHFHTKSMLVYEVKMKTLNIIMTLYRYSLIATHSFLEYDPNS